MADEAKQTDNTAPIVKVPEQPPLLPDGKVNLQALLEAGVHFGHQVRRWNPRMQPYIYAARDGIHVFDLIKTAEELEKARAFARKLGKDGKTLVFVGTKRQAQEIVKAEAEAAGAMYISTRWLGGFLTNWEQVHKSISKMNRLKEDLAAGKYDHYTKYERLQMQKEIIRLERFFIGVSELRSQPDALFMVDLTEEAVAAKEAAITKTPVIAIVDSNGNPEMAQFVIPGNDDAVSSIQLLTHLVAQAYAEGVADRKKAA